MGRLLFPSALGIHARRTGGAWYRPDWKRSSSERRFASRSFAYSSAVCPSIPGAPSLRVALNAARKNSTSMWWARVVNATPGRSRASSATRRSFVETLVELGVSGIVPSNDSSALTLPSLHGVSWTGFPRFPGTTERSDASSSISQRSRCRAAIPALRPCSLPATGTHRPGYGVWSPVPRPVSWAGDDEASQVPGGPHADMPRFSDPGEPAAPGHPVLPCCLPVCERRRRSRLMTGFGARSRGLSAPCLRFATSVALGHARLGSGWWPALARRDWLPAGSLREVSDYVIVFLLSQASPGAHTSGHDRARVPTRSVGCAPNLRGDP